jgi:4-coumarate--CoA ligase
MLSHYNFVAQLVIIAAPSREFMAKEIAAGTMEPLPPARSLAHLPAAHIAGTFGYLIGPIFGGSTVFWMRKYNWPDFLRLAGERRITTIYTVPSIYLRMAKDPAVKDQFKYLYSATAGAAPIDAPLQAAAGKKTGSGHVSQAWGLSETTGAVTAPVRGMDPDHTGSISPLLPNVEMRFVDEHDNVGFPNYGRFYIWLMVCAGCCGWTTRRNSGQRSYCYERLSQESRSNESSIPKWVVCYRRYWGSS